MSDKQIRVLVVDDSAVMRTILRELIQGAPDMKVVGTATNGQEALDQIATFKPDVVTLDVQMPTMDGLKALEEIFSRDPLPVIMVSSLTSLGAKVTLDALERGALDCVLKPESGSNSQLAFGREVLQKIRSSAGIDVRRILKLRQDRKARQEQMVRQSPISKPHLDVGVEELTGMCIALGISTGGPSALTVLFESLRPPLPGMVIVQHMPLRFTGPLAMRLDGLSPLSIKEAEVDDVVRPNHVLIAPAGQHLSLKKSGDNAKVTLNEEPPVSGHRPSVDVMMGSAAKIFGSRCLGVVMTGMGRDGSDGCGAIRAAGGYVLGQNETTSDVYGMNKVAFVSGHVDKQFGLDEGAAAINAGVQWLLKKE